MDTVIFHLQKGNSILYPTDTVWGIGCDATNSSAIKKIYKIKQRENSKNFIILVSSLNMLNNYISNIPREITEYLLHNQHPTTVIYNTPKNLPKNIIAKDNTIAIRIINNGFSHELIKKFGKPIISTSANISGFSTPVNYSDINKKILAKVDYIVKNDSINELRQPSKIIQYINNKIIILRD